MTINVTNISPTPGSTLARAATLSFDVTFSPADAIVEHAVSIGYGSSYELVWDGAGFRTPFTSSSRAPRAGGGYRYTVRRTGSWPGVPVLSVYALGETVLKAPLPSDALLYPPSGDTSGDDDETAIDAALTAGRPVYLVPDATYYSTIDFTGEDIRCLGTATIVGVGGPPTLTINSLGAENAIASTAYSGSVTLPLATSRAHDVGLLTGDITIDASGLSSRDGTVTIRVQNQGGKRVTWAAKFVFGLAHSPEAAQGPYDVTTWTFRDNGSTLECIGREERQALTPANISGAAAWLSARRQVSVSTWEDQIGANDAVQATAGNQPASATYAGASCLDFDGTDNYMLQPVAMADGAKWIAIAYKADALPSATFGSIVRLLGASGKYCEILLMDLGGYKDLSFMFDFAGAGAAACGIDPPLDLAPHVLVIQYAGGTVSNPDQYKLWIDANWRAPRASAFFNAEANAIGAIGARATSLGAVANPASIKVFDFACGVGTLTRAQVDRITSEMLGGTGRKVRLAPQVVCDGNSLTRGQGATLLDTNGWPNGYPEQLAALLGGADEWNVVNLGVNGQTTVDMITDFDSEVAPLYNPLRPRNILIAWEMGNHILGGASADTALEKYIDYCQRARRAGFEVIACDVPKRADLSGGTETIRQLVNASLDSSWSAFADAKMTLSDKAEFSNTADATYYTDGTHHTSAGHAVTAAEAHTQIKALNGKAHVAP